MKDKEVRELFNQYRRETVVPEKFRVGVSSHYRYRLAWASCAALVLLVAGAIVFWPQPTLAAALERMEEALTDVSSMRAVIKTTRSGKEVTLSTISYMDEKWRYDILPGAKKETVQIRSGGIKIVHHASLPYATTGRPYGSLSKPSTTALDYVKSRLNFGDISVSQDMKLLESEPYQGRATYRIVLTRKGVYSEIIVDAETDLPISTFTEESHGSGTSSKYTTDYEWNLELDASLFTTDSLSVPVLDRDLAVKSYIAKWSVPIAEVRIDSTRSLLRDVTVSQSGAVFLVYTFHANDEGFGPVPESMTDNAGNLYSRAREYAPGASAGNVPVIQDLALDGGEMRIAVFVPADTEIQSAELNIQWRLATTSSPQLLRDPGFLGAIESVSLKTPERFSQEFPDYSAALIVDYYHLDKWPEITTIRSELLFKNGRFDEAVEWGWKTYEAMAQDSPFHESYLALPLIFNALEASGKAEEAEKVRQRFKDEQAQARES